MLSARQVLLVVHSRYFTSGLVSAVGVAILGLATYAIGGLPPAVALGSGALTVCFADNPGPKRVKLVELTFASLASTLAFALVGASLWWPASQVLLIPLLGVASGLIATWGKRALALSFSVLFISVITVGAPPFGSATRLAAAVALFLLGSLLYTGYALLLSRLLARRTKRQALAELLVQLGRFAHWVAQAPADDADAGRAVALLTAVNDALQECRDVVLRDIRSDADRALVSRLFVLLDVNEALLASQTDAELIRVQFDATPVPDALRDWAGRIADLLDGQAMALLRGIPEPSLPAWLPCAETIDQALTSLRPSRPSAEFAGAQMALRASAERLQRITDLLGAAAQTPADPLQGIDLRAFVSPLHYGPGALLRSLQWRSPFLRYGLRLGLALLAGELLLRVLPYHPHDYWVLLTIGVILRPNFSVTRRRVKDRLLGTLLGCIVVAAILSTRPGLGTMVLGVFISLALARTFIILNYRFTALFASVNALLLVSLLGSGGAFLVTQRLQDTLLGAALAWAFSFVLPRWEETDLRRQTMHLLRAATGYAQAVLDPAHATDVNYRRQRKALHDALATLGGLHARMLEEPRRHRRGARDLGAFIGHSYILNAHLATLRVLRARRGEQQPPAPAQQLLTQTLDRVLPCLDAARLAECVAAPSAAPAEETPLQRRLREIEGEARTMARLARQIVTPTSPAVPS